MTRWVNVQEHGQKIDGKNMLHCRRLIDMAVEISEGKGVVVKRPNAKELLDIRSGKVDLQNLLKTANEQISKMYESFKNSSLPNKVDSDFVNSLLVNVRTEFYKSKQIAGKEEVKNNEKYYNEI
jgi:hypothetical protein